MAELTVVMYHYVRDFERSRFPRLKGMPIDAFRDQVAALAERFEMISLTGMLDFLSSKYQPERDLAVLTFDDGLCEHAEQVTPILAQHGIQGQFFVSTKPLTDGCVLPVHQVHLVMAELGEQEFCQRIRDEYEGLHGEPLPPADPDFVAKTYRWDTPETASVKASLNFVLAPEVKEDLVTRLFQAALGAQEPWSRELYAGWDALNGMIDAGMVVGGHSHGHQALSTLDDGAHDDDLTTNHAVLREHLRAQEHWPFCVPYGKRAHFHPRTAHVLEELGYCCAFSTELGTNPASANRFCIQRLDCKDVK